LVTYFTSRKYYGIVKKESWYRFQNLNHISTLVEGMKKTFLQVERGVGTSRKE
jgi:hypothetical protein